ncbi:hypothetical protein A0H81_12957 [Grifola frondosa]|uniref:Uncharacterized protein n=1 Tax=Grifola frondosa TaxID=5627 RepID=A0A1C7LR35_GRIFR|nr:hypothetical protein A0H81_12957 [Grifola frondosa]
MRTSSSIYLVHSTTHLSSRTVQHTVARNTMQRFQSTMSPSPPPSRSLLSRSTPYMLAGCAGAAALAAGGYALYYFSSARRAVEMGRVAKAKYDDAKITLAEKIEAKAGRIGDVRDKAKERITMLKERVRSKKGED